MSFIGQYAFNLFFNSTCSFLAGLGVVWVAVRLFRIDRSRWKLLLLTLPFVKIIWDLSYRGIPASSIVHAGINPLTLPPKSQTLTIGAGFSEFGPIFNLVFTANLPGGKQYSASFADYLFALMSKYLGHGTPYALLLGAVGIAVLLIARRLILAIRFERIRRKWRTNDQALQQIALGWRLVDIYSSRHYKGTPFTGGVLHPYICIPGETCSLLSAKEREAVVQHELGHVKQWDLLVTFIVQGLGDLFWFIPGYRSLSRKIDRMREILADDAAIRAGVLPEFLASALLALQTSTTGASDAVLYSAFFREQKLLKLRVERLLGRSHEKPVRLGWGKTWIKILVTTWTAGAVMITTFGGNHEVSVKAISSWMDLLPFGLGSLLKMLGA